MSDPEKCYSDHNEDIRTKGSCDYCKGTEPDPPMNARSVDLGTPWTRKARGIFDAHNRMLGMICPADRSVEEGEALAQAVVNIVNQESGLLAALRKAEALVEFLTRNVEAHDGNDMRCRCCGVQSSDGNTHENGCRRWNVREETLPMIRTAISSACTQDKFQ